MRQFVEDSLTKVKKDDEYWLTSDGRLLKIVNMDCTHIFNTVQMLRKYNRKVKKQRKLYKEAYKRLKQAGQIGYKFDKKKFKQIKIPDLMLKRYEFCKKQIPEYYL
jgi:hypothetical protein